MIHCLRDDELASLQPLFENVFKHPISLELLRWKYADAKGQSWVSINTDGTIEMHCGLSFRSVLVCGEPVQAVQLMDLMASEKTKGLARKDSTFTALMHQILHALPRPDNEAGIAFGFPSNRAMRLGEHLGVYREVDQMMDLEFSPQGTPVAKVRYREITNINTQEKAQINKLWADMAVDFSAFAIGIRNAQYISHRYLSHPDKKYTLLLIEKKILWYHVPIGLAVIGSGGERRELLDVVCSNKNLQDLIQTAQYWLMQKKCEILHFFLTEKFAKQLAPLAKSCEATQFRIMGNPFSPAEKTMTFDRKWWLTGGDTDYR